ncbi:MAG TPA: hypothetical protein VNM24_16815 [Burkholderiales bacterium]|jgi:hypothetical protein|nr:hypothetical protein [Burkholderiales bacterium]
MELILGSLRALIARALSRWYHASDATRSTARKLDQRLGEIYSRTMSERLHL